MRPKKTSQHVRSQLEENVVANSAACCREARASHAYSREQSESVSDDAAASSACDTRPEGWSNLGTFVGTLSVSVDQWCHTAEPIRLGAGPEREGTC